MLKNHELRQDAQRQLRETMAFYGGWRKHHGDDPAMTQRRFFLTFGTDVMTAQTLGAREALDLRQRVQAFIDGRTVPKAREPASEAERVAEIWQALDVDRIPVSEIAELAGLTVGQLRLFRPEGVRLERARGRNDGPRCVWWCREDAMSIEIELDQYLNAAEDVVLVADMARKFGVRPEKIGAIRPVGWKSTFRTINSRSNRVWERIHGSRAKGY